ncbi:MAG: XylR family transcriptional regulator [Pirellulales bacterium]|nr:XylR family transcriptional regulator [Pirellulales bacterium]
MSEPRRIALLMGQDAGFHRQVLLGIRAYASNRRDWQFHNAPLDSSTLRPLREWNPHGIIAHLAERRTARSVLRLGKPVVDTACAIPDLRVPTVDVDHESVGRMAAEYFLGLGHRHFGFHGGLVHHAKMRLASFRDALAKAGCDVSACHVEYVPRLPAGVSWKSVNRRVRGWLRRLPTPVAILADHDAAARDLADACARLGLRVPDDVAILGVDNDELECQLAFPPLSSVAIPTERIGYEAARLLDRMLAGHAPPRQPMFLPPLRVVARQSTDTLAVDDEVVAGALRYIQNHLADPIRVGAIAEAMVVRRRVLEKRFRALLGRSVLSEIHRQRIEQTKELLLNTDLSVSQIDRRAGFSSPQRLASVFRKVAGASPGEYRRQARPADA